MKSHSFLVILLVLSTKGTSPKPKGVVPFCV
nr:MAG TPA_asm: hypothetical protein [Caudoviricetes sp.]